MAVLFVGALVLVVVIVAAASVWERRKERVLEDGLAKVAAYLRDAVREHLGGDYSVRGTLRGVPLVVKLYEEDGDPASRHTSVLCTRAIDDRFTVTVVPRIDRAPALRRELEDAFLVTTEPSDLARSVFDEPMRAALLAFASPPHVHLAPGTGQILLVGDGYLTSDAAIAACELVATLVEKLDERALMCPRPA